MNAMQIEMNSKSIEDLWSSNYVSKINYKFLELPQYP